MIGKITIDIPKVEGRGEDAAPLSIIVKDSKGAVGVFDGLGGSGSTVYEENGVPFTGAYIAARIVKDICRYFIENLFEEDKSFTLDQIDIPILKNQIKHAFEEKLKGYSNKASKLKSSLIRTFPTTVAMALWTIEGESDIKITTLWAGDSRIYALNANIGLTQLTSDDLKMNNDPLENIFNDSPMSNVVQADTEYTINQANFTIKLPIILFAATDGCFGYYSTPMHFEYALLEALSNSANVEEWEKLIIDEFKNVSGDDCTLSLLVLGYANISHKEMVEQFKKRLNFIKTLYMVDLCEIDTEINILKKIKEDTKLEITSKEQDKKKKQRELWNIYKENYMLNPEKKNDA